MQGKRDILLIFIDFLMKKSYIYFQYHLLKDTRN